ncbi:MAG: hypothetical protein ORN57_01580, partial [Alphaproteobacteria bacterium]|nr:hypothetical protein [Alphaproteobacteria bacterium]
MSWLTKKKQKLTRPTKTNGTVPDNLWLKAPETNAMVHRDELAENFFVFPSGAHMRIGPRTRFDQLFDNANYNLLPPPAVPEDPLQFVDLKKYTDRLAAARAVKDIGITNESTKVKSTPIAKNAAGQIIPEDALVAASGAIGG